MPPASIALKKNEDKTVYVGWNSMCVSAYLEAAKLLNLAAGASSPW